MALVIDNHVHLITGTPGREYLPPKYRWWSCIGWAYGWPHRPPYERDPQDLYAQQESRVTDPDGSATVAAMDKAGVDAAVLVHADFGLCYGELQAKSMEEMHQDYVDVANRHPGRFYPFAGPDVRRPGSLDLVKAGLRDGRFKGQKVFPEVGYFPSDRILYPFYEANLEAGTPVAICTNFEPPMARARFNDPIHITDVVADFPDLNVIIFHAGYPFAHWFDIVQAIARYALNVYVTIEPWLWGYPGWGTTEEQGIRKLAQLRDSIGAHRINFGTDGQFSRSHWGERAAETYVRRVTTWRELPERAKRFGITFSQEEVDLMLGLNLARLLKIVEMPEYDKKRKYGWKILTPTPRPTP
ncbi:MAG: amidohydrolase family protein [Chloroflexi bacterium]|nr:amidohydrolase family protein [Chloroflexota bacterium]